MVNNTIVFAKINSQYLKEQKDTPLHEKESHFILIIPLLWARDKEYVFLDILTKNSFTHGLSYKICPVE